VAGWTAVVALAVAVGPLVGGLLLTVAGWPSLFWFNVPLAMAAALVVPPFASGPRTVVRLDVRGCMLLAGLLLGVVGAVTELPGRGWGSLPVLGGAAAAAACALLYRRHERSADAVLPTRVFRSPRLAAASTALLVMFAALFGIAFLLPLYLQIVRGLGALPSGLFVLGYAVALMAGSLAAGAQPPGRHRRLAVVGLAGTAGVHAAAAAWLSSATPTWAVVLGLVLIGLGVGFAQPPLTEAVLAALGSRAGLGSALNDVIREVGGVLGVAVLGSVAAVAGATGRHAGVTDASLLAGLRAAALVATALLAAAALVTGHRTTVTTVGRSSACASQ
jgi:predicted MFS family arabinose efflux permease